MHGWAPPTTQFHPGNQSYERLQQGDQGGIYGGASPQRLQGTQSFTSRYYDSQLPATQAAMGGGGGGGRELGGGAENASFQSVGLQSEGGSFASTGRSGADTGRGSNSEEAQKPKRGRASAGEAGQYCVDNLAKLLLGVALLLVAATALYALVVASSAVLAESFGIFSTLAWMSWYPSFYAIMIGFCLLAASALVTSAAGLWVGWKETRALLRSFCIASAVLGIILICLAGLASLYGERAKPDVIRAANLFCRDPGVWRCPAPQAASLPSPLLPTPGTVTVTRRLFGEEDAAAWPWTRRVDTADVVHAFAATLADPEREGPAETPLRRLAGTVGSAVMGFVSTLPTKKTASDDASICHVVEKMCSAPAGFDENTACLCNGNWDKAPPRPATTPAPTPAPVPAATTPAPTLAAMQTAAAASVQAVPGAAADAAPASTTAEWPSVFATMAPPAPAGRLRRLGAADDGTKSPWDGTVGVYCNDWQVKEGQPGESSTSQWCFVTESMQCSPKADLVAYAADNGEKLQRSSGPCGDQVSSRSEYVLDGYNAMQWPLQITAALGSLLLVASCSGALLMSRLTKPTSKAAESGARVLDGGAPTGPGPAGGGVAVPGVNQKLEEAFDQAQRDAVTRLRDETPEDLKLLLYGFYKQAKEGDVQGPRPGFFNTRERSKYDYWARHRGMSHEDAIDGYIKTVALVH